MNIRWIPIVFLLACVFPVPAVYPVFFPTNTIPVNDVITGMKPVWEKFIKRNQRPGIQAFWNNLFEKIERHPSPLVRSYYPDMISNALEGFRWADSKKRIFYYNENYSSSFSWAGRKSFFPDSGDSGYSLRFEQTTDTNLRAMDFRRKAAYFYSAGMSNIPAYLARLDGSDARQPLNFSLEKKMAMSSATCDPYTWGLLRGSVCKFDMRLFSGNADSNLIYLFLSEMNLNNDFMTALQASCSFWRNYPDGTLFDGIPSAVKTPAERQLLNGSMYFGIVSDFMTLFSSVYIPYLYLNAMDESIIRKLSADREMYTDFYYGVLVTVKAMNFLRYFCREGMPDKDMEVYPLIRKNPNFGKVLDYFQTNRLEWSKALRNSFPMIDFDRYYYNENEINHLATNQRLESAAYIRYR